MIETTVYGVQLHTDVCIRVLVCTITARAGSTITTGTVSRSASGADLAAADAVVAVNAERLVAR